MHVNKTLPTFDNVPLQEHYLYHGNWAPNVDGVLIDYMLRLKEEVGWIGEDFPTTLMPQVARELRDKCGFSFTEPSIVICICFLSVRRKTFHAIIITKGTYWDRVENFVYAVDSVWNTIMQTIPFAAAYYNHGETEYNRLRKLFGTSDNMEAPTVSVIEISSSGGTIALSNDDMEVDTDEEEVNSPVFLTKVGVRCKLFDEEDGANPSQKAPASEPTPTSRNVRSRFERVPSSHTSTHDGVNVVEALNNVSPYGSSVASKSPYSREMEHAKQEDRK